ncbi:glycosyltransferase family 2 protein [Soonwooa sp.]|uniref:glycosyltransferase family 2 protein n=1 Tax=Soonwooa sp. TaxID=1938592 RepID=UPI00260B9E74|nr:glycosyltransferase family 2 protein [Soonwooa sp.]
MVILIKSFNRAFYLDRCLSSIFKFAEGNFIIKIVDDGTPEKYLQKIKDKHPTVEIILSDNYQIKSQLISDQKEVDGFTIPVKEWKKAVNSSDKYTLIIEDDVWFTDPINFHEIIQTMDAESIDLVKLGWQGAEKYNFNYTQTKLNQKVIAQYPNKKLFLANAKTMNMVLENKFKLKSILCRLNLFNNYTPLEYYELFSILMGLYNKDYWNYLWKDIDVRVSERKQMVNAIEWRSKNIKKRSSICRTDKEYLKTTYSSTATNSYRKYKTKVDINKINRILNDLWLNDKLDSENNMPKDFDLKYLTDLVNVNYPNEINMELWHQWIGEFKEDCLSYGAVVD